MIIFPDHNSEIEYTDPNGSVWDWNGVGWVRQCSGGGDIKPEGYDDTKAIASGVMTTGEMVVLNDDGTVSVVEGAVVVGGVGDDKVFNSGNTVYLSSAYDPASNKVVIAYQDVDNSKYGTAVVGTVLGDSISFGTPVVFSSEQALWTTTIHDPAENKIVIAFHKVSGGGKSGCAVVGAISGDSISFGAPATFDSSNKTVRRTSSTYDSATNKVVIAYENVATFANPTAVVGAVSGNSITFGTPVTLYSGEGYWPSAVYDPVANKVVIVYNDNDSSSNIAVVATVSGSSISPGTPVEFGNEGETGNYFVSVYDSVNNKVVIAFNIGSIGKGGAIVGEVSGDSITFGPQVYFSNGGASALSAIYNPAVNKVALSFSDSSNSSYGTAIGGEVSGDSITFETPVVFNDGATAYTALTYDPVAIRVVVAYRDGDNSNDGTAVTYSPGGTVTNLTDSNYIGVSTGNYADGAEATVQIAGINDDQRRMTIGKQYIQPDGSLDITEGTPSVEAGTAISPTELNIKDTV